MKIRDFAKIDKMHSEDAKIAKCLKIANKSQQIRKGKNAKQNNKNAVQRNVVQIVCKQ